MKILAIEASGQVASVAIAHDDKVLGEYSINYKKTHSETLLPMIDEVVRMTETELESIDAIAVSKGPGSFTGLRIGSATAKGLGLALDKPIIPVPTVDGMAYRLWGNPSLICPLMDARRRQVYTGLYAFEGDQLIVKHEQCLAIIDDLIARLNELQQPVVFMGDASVTYEAFIRENAQFPVSFAPAALREQSAAAIAMLGKKMMEHGITETAREHKPDYLRASQAERELGNKAKDFRI
ncbi:MULTISPECIES: tRNA (adenosine(37)-N6)-threonylcarbamoyltransferase complex dimerization subunit type 1 TsaB [Agathobacter]|uniref:tRNA (Adenosine(37)-N6)-threonylcarbamoyltransferase complex dimerization subunit type 1 TsaB n=1 Tax=Agathobacter ruminis TaxID=1712665 RepID=A0A2G3E020_9FIRM|nr:MULTISPECIES: tRNA (adenosine(37)-N6)-threonylcarbamoyltransferase complex dimerization subunit type 1 TsaB [Agathobacter]MCR5677300.1 tRNA (adenosine(37)-N6)-threonylcarbamoyltransferase complex dimerization subunit type 1 TsaB [Agathobacter sp.]MDC7302220.1 tRNA (adenosine(37)-N6)-threonylcarbamoyltransferase complex dimerization subunit type 1 TsaB [Agathobacter ruminis]PHU36473.1 tRNA (adenosine(37)-N6)-threonylcarbamoyltransferase complex dimerization subunit type 1 TsaB [Agathobacter ru